MQHLAVGAPFCERLLQFGGGAWVLCVHQVGTYPIGDEVENPEDLKHKKPNRHLKKTHFWTLLEVGIFVNKQVNL
jgi:hypothetical protein